LPACRTHTASAQWLPPLLGERAGVRAVSIPLGNGILPVKILNRAKIVWNCYIQTGNFYFVL
jgi:hypothetical protein